MPKISIRTRFGMLTVTETDGAISALAWGRGSDELSTTRLLREAKQQLEAYCACELTVFDLPLSLPKEGLLQQVCSEMAAIPFGDTTTYGTIASRIGATTQAVGQACGRNPIPIIVPCHRVMGASGKLVGFSGGAGVETKVALLRHESADGLLI